MSDIVQSRQDVIGNTTSGIKMDRSVDQQPESSAADLLDRVEADLHRGPGLLRFNGEAETRFAQSRVDARVRHFVWTSLVGLLFYDLFLFVDSPIVPDVFDKMVLIHLAVTPIALSVVLLIHRRRLPAESIVVSLLLILADAAYTAHASHAHNAFLISFTIPLVVLFSNILLPLPFPLAIGFSMAASMAAAWSVWTQPKLDVSVSVFATLMESTVAVFTLIATYKVERGERQTYLLALRESLRGELLVEQNRALSELSETDPLTGIGNRRVFDRELEQLWVEHQQSRTPLALLMIDIDHFKKLNDTYGHANGDICLRKAAERLRSLMRPHQSLARYGGEEFAVLLEGEGAFRAEEVAERLRAEIAIMPIRLAGTENKPHHMTISVGCATMIPRVGIFPGELFAAADGALYAAKHSGRNRVCVDDPSPRLRKSTPASWLVGNATT